MQRTRTRLNFLALVGLALVGAAAMAQQSYCSSDGQPTPSAVLERFMDADCEACWKDAQAPRPAPGELALDWVTPGAQGDDAPMSAIATRGASERLRSLALAAPAGSVVSHHARVAKPALALRVAHGLPFNDYIGTSIGLTPAAALRGKGKASAWLLLVETLAPGTEGTPVERNLVRNTLVVDWDGNAGSQPAGAAAGWFEARSMRIPDGADPKRLRLVGLLEDASGHLLAAAVSRCAATSPVARW